MYIGQTRTVSLLSITWSLYCWPLLSIHYLPAMLRQWPQCRCHLLLHMYYLLHLSFIHCQIWLYPAHLHLCQLSKHDTFMKIKTKSNRQLHLIALLCPQHLNCLSHNAQDALPTYRDSIGLSTDCLLYVSGSALVNVHLWELGEYWYHNMYHPALIDPNSINRQLALTTVSIGQNKAKVWATVPLAKVCTLCLICYNCVDIFLQWIVY
jgi:hypothetical protein